MRFFVAVLIAVATLPIVAQPNPDVALPDAPTPSFSSSLDGVDLDFPVARLISPAQINALNRRKIFRIRGKDPDSYKWTKTDKVLFWVNTGVLLLDWGETLNIARNPERLSEINPILGKHPSLAKVNWYFGTSVVVHGVASYLLTRKKRRKLEIILSNEVWTQANNLLVSPAVFPEF